MELKLKQGLPHQQKGIQAVANSLTLSNFSENKFFYTNPVLNLDKEVLLSNIKNVQEHTKIHPEYKGLNAIGNYLNLDVKMETGTGKTYVYASTIFELHRRFNINKFIVVCSIISSACSPFSASRQEKPNSWRVFLIIRRAVLKSSAIKHVMFLYLSIFN